MHSDQHNPFVTGYMGDAVARTPHLDRMSAEGATLETCYCPSTVCVPSRMSTLAGLLPSETRVYGNAECLPSDMATFPHALALAGYDTVLCGRMHFVGPDQRHGYRRRIFPDITGTQVGYNAPSFGPGWLGTTGGTRFAVDRAGAGHTSVLGYDDAVIERACRFLADYDADAPFFLTVGTYGPHCPYVCPRELFDYYYPRVTMPAVPDPDLEHPITARMYEERKMADTPPEAIRRARAAYYGMVELIDGHLGRLLDALAARGQLDDTLVIYTSDHGDMLGEHGIFAKHIMYEESARVPALARWPAAVPAGRRIAQPISLLDLAPTLIGLTGAPALPAYHGEDILGLLTGDAPENPERPVIAMIRMGVPFAMLRRGRWKLIAYHGHPPQLFDLTADPREEHDLGRDPAHTELREALLAELSETWDGEAMARAIARSGQHTSLVGKFNRIDFADDPAEAWPGDPTLNYLEETADA